MTREEIIQGLYRGDSRAIKEAIKALEKEPCEDCISREALLDKKWDVPYDGKYIQVVDVGDIKDLPSVTPARKKGKWIDKEKIMFPICSKCGLTSVEKYSFCPNCGEEMRVEEWQEME